MGANLPAGTVLGNANVLNATGGNASGSASSGATGGVSTPVTSAAAQ
jgi:hypothetical protein